MKQQLPKIAILGGTGALGSGLARVWASAGHAISIGSRSAERAVAKAGELGAQTPRGDFRGHDLAGAAEWGDIVTLTVPYASQLDILAAVQHQLPGKILVDATVPLRPPKVGTVQLPEQGSAAVAAQAFLGDSVKVVSAFQNVGAHNFATGDAIDCDVLVAGNDTAAREQVVELVHAAGMRGWHAGPLANAAAAEALTSVLIQINRRHRLTGSGIRITSGTHGSAQSHAPDRLELTALADFPTVESGDRPEELILSSLRDNRIPLANHDVIVIAQKIISKAEGRRVRLSEVSPSAEAVALAGANDKDPRLVELILRESNTILREGHGVIVVEHRLGHVLANAGIDQSNVDADDETVLLLPEYPDRSARTIRDRLAAGTRRDIAVIINDSMGRAWRKGTIGHALGTAGLAPLLDLRHQPDRGGRLLRVSEVALADELAAAASLLMGQGAEGKPVVLIRGLPATPDAAGVGELLRGEDEDLFR